MEIVYALVMELVVMRDLKSLAVTACRFDSCLGHVLNNFYNMNKKLKIFTIIAAALLLSYGVVRIAAYKYVQPDEIGVWMTNGGYNGMQDYQVWTGSFPFDFTPATKSFILPGNPWSVDLPTRQVLSKENGKWIVDPKATFSIIREMAPYVTHKYSSYLAEGKDSFLTDIGEHFLVPIIDNTYVEIIGSNRDTLMMNDKMGIARVIEDSIRVRFARLGFHLDNFVTGVTPPKSILDTKEAENTSIQAVFTAKAETIKANAEAAVLIAKAKANAEAMLVTSRAEAEALRNRREAVTPLLLQEWWIDKWDGALPMYITGAQAGMMLGLPK